MENQIVPAPLSESIDKPRSDRGGWIVSPVFDLLFVCNIAWLTLLIPGMANRNETAIDFWQVYFITLPHRWITLVLVLADPDRREQRGRRLAIIAATMAAAVAGTQLFSGAFLCLAIVDFLWNAWHFASQHAGILRIYGRKQHPSPQNLERWAIRLFVTYAILRTPGWVEGWSWDPQALTIADAGILLIPAAMMLRSLIGIAQMTMGKFAYLTSVCGVYTGMIVAANVREGKWILVFSTASALFHATEYLAIVTHYSWNRQTIGSRGLFARMAGQWTSLLLIYLVMLGCLGTLLDASNSRLREAWIGLNLWAAFTHYAFDGMIWKLRRPDTARSLGITNDGSAQP